MKTVVKVLRYLMLIFLLLCASFGMAFGAVLFNNRFQAHDKETTIEMLVKKDEEDNEERDASRKE